jgi:hypothetical protein
MLEYLGSRRCPANDQEPSRFDLACLATNIWGNGGLLSRLEFLYQRGETPDISNLKFAAQHGPPIAMQSLLLRRWAKLPMERAQDVSTCMRECLSNDRVSHLRVLLDGFPMPPPGNEVADNIRSHYMRMAVLCRSWGSVEHLLQTNVKMTSLDQSQLQTSLSTLDPASETAETLILLLRLELLSPGPPLYQRATDANATKLCMYLLRRDRAFHAFLSSTAEGFLAFQRCLFLFPHQI